MTPAVKTVPDDDELPELAPLDTDEGVVEVPDEIRPDAWDDSLVGDDELAGLDPGAVAVLTFAEVAAGEDDEGSPDDPIDALPDDDRGAWVGDEERPGDDGVEIHEPPGDQPDGGEDGPTRDPYDEVDTALPALDDDDGDEGPADEPPA